MTFEAETAQSVRIAGQRRGLATAIRQPQVEIRPRSSVATSGQWQGCSWIKAVLRDSRGATGTATKTIACQ
ncbi:MAG: hypothetical protein AAF721_04750 [Myxococcota bacterium]